MAASTTVTIDTTSPLIQPATSAAMRAAPRAVPIAMTPAVATRRASIDSNVRRSGFSGRNPPRAGLSADVESGWRASTLSLLPRAASDLAHVGHVPSLMRSVSIPTGVRADDAAFAVEARVRNRPITTARCGHAPSGSCSREREGDRNLVALHVGLRLGESRLRAAPGLSAVNNARPATPSHPAIS